MLAPMRLMSKRTALSISIVVSLVAILAVLAVLQYRWSGQVSQAERDRMQASLDASMSQFRQELDRELQQLAQAYAPDSAILVNKDWQHYTQSAADLLSGSEGHLVQDLYLWFNSGDESSQLMMLDREVKALRPVPWPPRFQVIQERYIRALSGSSRLPPDIRPSSWTVLPDIPMLLHPLMLFQPPAVQPAMANPRHLGYLMIELNLKAMREELLPELAQRYFGGPAGFIYQVAIVSGRDPGAIVYQSDPNLTPAEFASPDARIGLLDNPRGRMGRRGPGPEIDAMPPGEGRPPFSASGMEPPRPGRGRGWPMLLSASDSVDWELVAKHRQGSLEAVVTGLRRRNLAISFGILLLLASSIALIIAFTQRAQRLAQLQIDFVAGVSHELRTPLAVICSAGDNLAEGVVAESSRQVRQYGELIRNEGWKLTGMVEQILQFAGGLSGRRKYSLRPARIEEALEAALKQVHPMIVAGGFKVEQSVEMNLPLVNMDASALSQCIQNLLNNAMKYSGDSRWLAIRVESFGGEKGPVVRLVVEDKGIGIDPADVPHIFDPFYRGRAVMDAQIHGTGLGLCTAREAVVAMGGSISVKSTPGKGSAFTISLPALASGEAAKP